MHGAKSPQAKAAAGRRLAEERARSELASLGERAEPVWNPAEELARVCGEAVALADVLRHHVARAADVTGGEVGAYLAALGRAESALTAALRAGVEQRQVRLAEEQGALLASAIRAVMAWVFERLDAGADLASVRDGWPTIAGRELRAISERQDAP